jgi:surface polysaccharide O-acyltransferase-like enzyme
MLRGIAIVFVVMLHATAIGWHVLPVSVSDAWLHAVVGTLVLVCVPTFFLVMGVVLAGRPRRGEGRAPFAIRRAVRLALPLFAFSWLALAVSVGVTYGSVPHDIVDWLGVVLLGNRWFPLYFVVVALQLSLLVAVLPRTSRARTRAILALIGLQVASEAVWLFITAGSSYQRLVQAQMIADYIPTFWAGYLGIGMLAAPHLDTLLHPPPRMRRLTLAAALVIAVGVAITGVKGPPGLVTFQSPLFMLHVLTLAPVICWTLMAMPQVIRRIMARLGLLSYGIYLTHGVVLPILGRWVNFTLLPGTPLADTAVAWLLSSIAGLAIAAGLAAALRLTPPGRLLVGEPWSGVRSRPVRPWGEEPVARAPTGYRRRRNGTFSGR